MLTSNHLVYHCLHLKYVCTTLACFIIFAIEYLKLSTLTNAPTFNHSYMKTRGTLRTLSEMSVTKSLLQAAAPLTNQVPVFDTSIRAYYMTPNTIRNIELWIDGLPTLTTEYEEAWTRPKPTASHFYDWLNWFKYKAIRVLKLLDKYERSYREIGLKWHLIPHPIRHSKMQLDNIPLSAMTVGRLQVVFESDAPREKQRFFAPWLSAAASCSAIIIEVQAAPSLADIDTLSSILRCNQELYRSTVLDMQTVSQALKELEHMVGAVHKHLSYEESKDLIFKSSVNGILWRRWVATLPELQDLAGGREERSRRVEEVANEMLTRGIRYVSCWQEAHCME